MQIQLLSELDPATLRQGDEVNVVVGWPRPRDFELILGPVRPEDVFIFAPLELTWPYLLARLGCFPSISQASKNWQAQGRDSAIAEGYTELTIGKARRIWIYVLKQTQDL